MGGGEPIRPANKSHLGSHADAKPSRRASPHTGLGSSRPHATAVPQHRPGRHTVDHKLLTISSFLSGLTPWPLESSPNTGEQNVLGWRPGCHKLLITDSQSLKNKIIEGLALPFCSSHPQHCFLQGQEEKEMPPLATEWEINSSPPWGPQGSSLPTSLALQGHNSQA